MQEGGPLAGGASFLIVIALMRSLLSVEDELVVGLAFSAARVASEDAAPRKAALQSPHEIAGYRIPSSRDSLCEAVNGQKARYSVAETFGLAVTRPKAPHMGTMPCYSPC